MKKQDLHEPKRERREGTSVHQGNHYITFTDLYEMKQVGLEKLLEEHGELFLLSKSLPPIKISLAKLS